MYDIATAILAINPSAQVSIDNEDLDKITWYGTSVISKADIQAKQAELKKAWDAQDYARKRKAEYDKLNQWELWYDDQKNGTKIWQNTINTIKAKYPKPS